MKMEIKLLREFICLAEHLNFREAAKKLYIAQPVLSRHIIEMEKELDVQLFIRNKQSVKLTAIGHVALEEAKGIIRRYEEAMNKIQLAKSGLAGELKIGFLEAAVKEFFSSLIINYRYDYPNIDLQMTQFNIGTLINAILEDKIDAGFTLSCNITKVPGIEWKKVYGDVFCVVLRSDHPLAKEEKISLRQLSEETFIIEESSGVYDQLLNLFKESGFAPQTIPRSAFPENVLLMVETGLGVAILPRHLNIYKRPGVNFVELEGEGAAVDIVLAWKKDNTNPAIPILLSELESMDINSQKRDLAK
jgi:DNA-binding transcriptional LysR family regulator